MGQIFTPGLKRCALSKGSEDFFSDLTRALINQGKRDWAKRENKIRADSLLTKRHLWFQYTALVLNKFTPIILDILNRLQILVRKYLNNFLEGLPVLCRASPFSYSLLKKVFRTGRSGQVLPIPHRQTYRQTLKDRATQLLITKCKL